MHRAKFVAKLHAKRELDGLNRDNVRPLGIGRGAQAIQPQSGMRELKRSVICKREPALQADCFHTAVSEAALCRVHQLRDFLVACWLSPELVRLDEIVERHRVIRTT